MTSSYIVSPTIDIRSLVNTAINERGPNIDKYVDDSNTLLHLAIKNDLVDCAIQLISAGADITIQNMDGMTPRDVALDSGNQVMLQVISRREEYMMQTFNRKKHSRSAMVVDKHDDSLDDDGDNDSKIMPLVLNSCAIYEDYFDWTDHQRCLHLQVLSTRCHL